MKDVLSTLFNSAQKNHEEIMSKFPHPWLYRLFLEKFLNPRKLSSYVERISLWCHYPNLLWWF